ncbi:hypothetical protein AB4851_05180 [Burkholderia sp. 22PA0099]|uniref:hypothetical protein n=1 Tax=Burkholderia sp. 22PA0099 TaxID=3237372 RepID=UPI0039C362AC
MTANPLPLGRRLHSPEPGIPEIPETDPEPSPDPGQQPDEVPPPYREPDGDPVPPVRGATTP